MAPPLATPSKTSVQWCRSGWGRRSLARVLSWQNSAWKRYASSLGPWGWGACTCAVCVGGLHMYCLCGGLAHVLSVWGACTCTVCVGGLHMYCLCGGLAHVLSVWGACTCTVCVGGLHMYWVGGLHMYCLCGGLAHVLSVWGACTCTVCVGGLHMYCLCGLPEAFQVNHEGMFCWGGGGGGG